MHGHGHHHEHGHDHDHGHSHGQYDKNRNPEDFARYLGKLEDPERERWQMPERVVDALGLRAGDVACDVGAGTGYLALRMARAVGPTGAVYAIDVDQRMIEEIGKRIGESGLENVHPILSHAKRGALPPRRCQVILTVNAFHHFPDGAAYLKRLAGRLAPGGRIVIVDFLKKATPVGPPAEHRISRVEVATAARRAGLEVARERRFLPYQYFLEFSPVRARAPGRDAKKPPPRAPRPGARRRAGRSTR
jgi:ubiquinone/menaquinone biosynthesis C-methylase UbiE